ncbi:MAG: hypothetical protein VKI81_12375, partial [Synechococcaceae cyanobacterium]|nr:hypothetical protein [Synechococcaceae cyanobacterium]
MTQRIPAGTGVVPGERVLARYQLEARGVHPLELRRLTVTSAGTIDETLFLGGVHAVVDSDDDGEVDPGEPQLAALPAPAFPADDGVFSLTL